MRQPAQCSDHLLDGRAIVTQQHCGQPVALAALGERRSFSLHLRATRLRAITCLGASSRFDEVGTSVWVSFLIVLVMGGLLDPKQDYAAPTAQSPVSQPDRAESRHPS